jgi:hypothetical protein
MIRKKASTDVPLTKETTPAKPPEAKAKVKAPVIKVKIQSEIEKQKTKPISLPNWKPESIAITDRFGNTNVTKAWIVTTASILSIGQLVQKAPANTSVEKLKLSPSIRAYSSIITKSPESISLQVGQAMLITLAGINPDNFEKEGKEIFLDLSTNLTGKAKQKGILLSSALTDPVLMRELRRGIMLAVSGSWATIALYSPEKFHAAIQSIGIKELIESVPVETSEPITYEQAKQWLREDLIDQDDIIFNEEIKFGTEIDRLTPLEKEIGGVTRTLIPALDTSNDPKLDQVEDSVLKLILKARKKL